MILLAHLRCVPTAVLHCACGDREGAEIFTYARLMGGCRPLSQIEYLHYFEIKLKSLYSNCNLTRAFSFISTFPILSWLLAKICSSPPKHTRSAPLCALFYAFRGAAPLVLLLSRLLATRGRFRVALWFLCAALRLAPSLHLPSRRDKSRSGETGERCWCKRKGECGLKRRDDFIDPFWFAHLRSRSHAHTRRWRSNIVVAYPQALRTNSNELKNENLR